MQKQPKKGKRAMLRLQISAGKPKPWPVESQSASLKAIEACILALKGVRMAPIPIGAISGLILSATTSYLITGRLFHPYQKMTAATWRPESWRHHLFAMLLQSMAGAGIGWVFALDGAPAAGFALFELGLGLWIVLVACILIQALYVNWHAGFVVGLVLDWTVFIAGVLLACTSFSTR